MVNWVAAGERVEALHDAAGLALSRARAVEQYLAQIYRPEEYDTAYSVEASTLVCRVRSGSLVARKRMEAVIVRALHEPPSRRQMWDQSVRLMFEGIQVVVEAGPS